MEEIMNTIKDMKPNKTTGQVGFFAIFNKKLKEKLCPVLKELIISVITGKKSQKFGHKPI